MIFSVSQVKMALVQRMNLKMVELKEQLITQLLLPYGILLDGTLIMILVVVMDLNMLLKILIQVHGLVPRVVVMMLLVMMMQLVTQVKLEIVNTQ